MCVLSIKVPTQKKSGNLFNDPRMCIFGVFGLARLYGISTIVGYLMPILLYTYILDIYDLVLLGFMAYQVL